jgi:hypothetical protein
MKEDQRERKRAWKRRRGREAIKDSTGNEEYNIAKNASVGAGSDLMTPHPVICTVLQNFSVRCVKITC